MFSRSLSGNSGTTEPNAVRVPFSSAGKIARSLLAAHRHLLSPVLQITHRAISTFLIKQAGLKHQQAATGAVTLNQRFGGKQSHANL
jgi:hypothetical protein